VILTTPTNWLAACCVHGSIYVEVFISLTETVTLTDNNFFTHFRHSFLLGVYILKGNPQHFFWKLKPRRLKSFGLSHVRKRAFWQKWIKTKRGSAIRQRDRATQYASWNFVNCCAAIYEQSHLKRLMTLKITQDHQKWRHSMGNISLLIKKGKWFLIVDTERWTRSCMILV